MHLFQKRFLSSFLMVLMVFNIFCTTASASIQSSEYLNSYRVGITPKSNGVLVITVDVTGVGPMTEIGAKTIYLYESKDNKHFSCVETFRSSENPQMIGSGSIFYEDVATYQGEVGYYYYATAFVYAANANGSDEKSCTSVIKRAKA